MVKTQIIGILLFVAYVRSDSNFLQEDDSESAQIKSNITYRLPEEFYRKAYVYMKASKELRRLTFEQTVKHIDDLETWEPPAEIVKDFPYYLAGYDYEDRPIWVAEAGKYDVRKWVIRGGDDLKNVEKYLFQATTRIMRSILERDRPEREVTQGVFFGDNEGLDISQVTHLPTMTFILEQVVRWKDIIAQGLGRMIIINANYPTRLAFDLLRPVAGKLMERVEIFGTNRAKWSAEIRRLLPHETIPTWYGGDKAFKPVKVYG